MFVLMFGGLFLPQLRELARAREAFRHGVLARGSVVYIRKRANTNWSNVQRAPYYDVYVAFQTQEGTRRESRAWCANEWLMLHLPPGAAVQLAYLPKRPEQIVLLEAFLR